ncbi:MAG: hypothetical protein HN802_01125 [Candidatus Jacksonbacteria bacterium]|jgi:hypothetical protein|nr:hypothetical protein [Candidatus Jacksonbacteria bacterium]
MSLDMYGAQTLKHMLEHKEKFEALEKKVAEMDEKLNQIIKLLKNDQ